MSWRKHPDHKSETQAVKMTLQAAGFQGVKVRHGTAWAWLEVKATIPPSEHYEVSDQFHHAGNCPGCEVQRQAESRIYAILHEVTGRSGDYNGNINLRVEERPA